jgi:hypothetical protein
VLYLSRLGLIALVDVTAAPAVNTQYLEPAFLALGLAGFLSLHALATVRRRPDESDGTAGVGTPAVAGRRATDEHPRGQRAVAGAE